MYIYIYISYTYICMHASVRTINIYIPEHMNTCEVILPIFDENVGPLHQINHKPPLFTSLHYLFESNTATRHLLRQSDVFEASSIGSEAVTRNRQQRVGTSWGPGMHPQWSRDLVYHSALAMRIRPRGCLEWLSNVSKGREDK